MMNAEQKAYALARAAYQLAKDEIKRYEQDFIVRENVRNQDGSVPDQIWALDTEFDEDYFDALCDKLDSEDAFKALCDAETEAYKNLQAAEDRLVDFSLSLPMPENVRRTLQEHRKEYKIRDRLIDLAFRLDTRTVKART